MTIHLGGALLRRSCGLPGSEPARHCPGGQPSTSNIHQRPHDDPHHVVKESGALDHHLELASALHELDLGQGAPRLDALVARRAKCAEIMGSEERASLAELVSEHIAAWVKRGRPNAAAPHLRSLVVKLGG